MCYQGFAPHLRLGHFEYDRYTLANEYFRDKKKNLPIDLPEFYFPDGDTTQEPVFKWRSYAHLFYMNWLNIVYQDTPYDLRELAPASGNKLDKAIGEYNKILLSAAAHGVPQFLPTDNLKMINF